MITNLTKCCVSVQPHRNQQKQPVLTNMYLCVLLRVHSSWGFWPFYAACWFQWSSCWLFSSLIYKMSLIIMTRHVHGNINTISVDKRKKLCLLHFLFCWHRAAECRTPDEQWKTTWWTDGKDAWGWTSRIYYILNNTVIVSVGLL